MSIQIVSQPEKYGLAYNDNAYVLRLQTPTPTKRVKVDVRTNTFPTETIATMTIYPTPTITGYTDRLFFDVSRIIQSKVETTLRLAPVGSLGFYFGGGGIFGYKLTLTEQDVDANGNYIDLWNYQLSPKIVWNGGIDLRDWVDFDVDDYLMDTGVGNHKFLTDGPTGTDYRDIGESEAATLSFIGNEINAPAGYYLATYDDFDAQGSQLNNAFVSNYNAAIVTANIANQHGMVFVGTKDIPLINSGVMTFGTPSTVLNGAKSYSIRMWDNSLPISEVITFNIGKKCSKYTPVRLHWLNRLGVFDSFNFNLKSEKTTKLDKKDYYQQPRVFTHSAYDYRKDARGTTRYDTQLTKAVTINTDYINDVESTWMESLFTSPMVYREVGDDLEAVTIDGRSIKEQTSLNNKLNQYTFNIESALINTRQRG